MLQEIQREKFVVSRMAPSLKKRGWGGRGGFARRRFRRGKRTTGGGGGGGLRTSGAGYKNANVGG